MRRGKIIARRDTQATVLEEGSRRTWKIPCVAMQGYTEADRRGEQAQYELCSSSCPPFSWVADSCYFRLVWLASTVGTLMRIQANGQKSSSVQPAKWKVVDSNQHLSAAQTGRLPRLAVSEAASTKKLTVRGETCSPGRDGIRGVHF